VPYRLRRRLPAWRRNAASAGAIDKLQRFLETTKTLRADFAQIGRRQQRQSAAAGLERRDDALAAGQVPLADRESPTPAAGWRWREGLDLRSGPASGDSQEVGAALGSTPAALLVGDNTIEKEFTLREAGEAAGLEWLEAVPKVQDSGFEKVRLGFAGNELQAMELLDSLGQTTLLRFSRLERNPRLAPSLFRFIPPANTDVIGE
jgi:outer membrane lipoprotein carrier protein